MPELVSAEQELWQPVTPKSDEVIAVFRNGAIIDIAAPGKRVRPLWYKIRGPGDLTYARVLRAEIQVRATLSSIPVQLFTLPEAAVSCRLVLNPVNDYAALRRRMEARGSQFQTALAAEVGNSLDEVVRGVFASLSHEQVVQAPRKGALWNGLVGTQLVQGLYVVESVDSVAPVADPQYTRQVEAVVGAVVDQDVRRRDAQEELGRDQIAAARAVLRGQTLEELDNPDLVRAREGQRHELVVQQEAAALTAAVEREHTERAIGVATVENLREVLRAAQIGAPLPPQVRQALGQSELPEGGSSGLEAFLQPLSRDAELVARWSSCGGSKRDVLGAVHVQQGGTGLVVLVLQAALCRDAAQLQHQLAVAFPAMPQVAIAAPAPLEEMVAQLVRQRVPAVEQLFPTFRSEEVSEDELRVLVSGKGNSGLAVRQITDHNTLVLPALTRLLPYSEISFVPE